MFNKGVKNASIVGMTLFLVGTVIIGYWAMFVIIDDLSFKSNAIARNWYIFFSIGIALMGLIFSIAFYKVNKYDQTEKGYLTLVIVSSITIFTPFIFFWIYFVVKFAEHKKVNKLKIKKQTINLAL
ncbi:hypothetical protein SCHIN_v1c08290 [Spiroplasma chinense]|uniref:Uncharacterized protein n=1 Tax=Spiroplasma chinense TaxID=216932 RepID=A0A5B9Y4K9_9MOLU|nr:hypothetical protein [Spiroplasma chinense]QEH62024.1 hypothetical protein SCHIN_v1c08290 [Spiroplasma chinense]